MRTEIWNYALQFIFERPLLGWGSGYFPLIIDQETGFWKGHPHNLILDSFFNFGIIVGSILLIFVLTIVIRAFNKIYIKNNSNLYDRAWFTSCLLLLLSQLVDQQYYDVRISLPMWVLLCGLKNIIEDKNYNQLTIK